MRSAFIFLLLAFVAHTAMAQDMNMILAELSGASSIEDVSEETLERLAALKLHPVDINSATKARLLATGLFSSYRVASLKDYIKENGEILSVEELGLVDGFGHDFAKAIEPFIKFGTYSPPGVLRERNNMTDNLLMLGIGVKPEDRIYYGGKYKLDVADMIDVGAVIKKGYSPEWWPPSKYGGYIACYSRKPDGKLIVGNFNTHFGQGLCLWSGFALSGLYGLRSVMRTPNGISPSLSFSDTDLSGAAAEVTFGRVALSALTAFEKTGVLPALRFTHTGRHGQISVNSMCRTTSDKIASAKVSIDTRACIGGTDLFGEAAWDIKNSRFAAIAGTIVPIGESFAVAASARYYPIKFDTYMTGAPHAFSKSKDEAAMTLGCRFRQHELNSEFGRNISDDNKQMKVFLSDIFVINDGLSICSKLTARLRNFGPRSRYSARLDFKWTPAHFLLNVRTEAVTCRKFGLLNYAEAGYKTDNWAAFFRATEFLADNWDDRIYVYERDAPGSFSAPAYYGRGYSLSAYANAKINIRRTVLKLYLRGAITEYSRMKEKRKPGKAELKFQLLYTW